jgi:predicted ATPase
MKIAFVGAHGTGKTTLSAKLVELLTASDLNVHATPEVPRLICKDANDPEFFHRSNNTLLKQMSLLVGQPVYETAETEDSDLIICDRSILDHWSYTLHLFSRELEESDVKHAVDTLVRKHCSSYEQIFYLPIEFPVEGDENREADQEFQKAIDFEIQDLLKRYDIPFIEVTGTVSERADQVLSYLPIDNLEN